MAGPCYTPVNTMSYTGDVSVTKQGSTCLPWTSFDFTDEEFPDGSVIAASNFCRTPGFLALNGTWCYIRANGDTEDCDVLLCGSAGWCQPKSLSFKRLIFCMHICLYPSVKLSVRCAWHLYEEICAEEFHGYPAHNHYREMLLYHSNLK